MAVRIALANLRFPATPDESVILAEQAIAQAADERADIICFPECFIPAQTKPKAKPKAKPESLKHGGSGGKTEEKSEEVRGCEAGLTVPRCSGARQGQSCLTTP